MLRGCRTSWRPLGALVLTLVLLGSACGDDDGGTADPGAADAIDLSVEGQGAPSPSGRQLLAGFTEVTVIVTAADGSTEEYCVLLADEEAEWARGLMEVVDLGDYPGMVFEFPDDRTGSFFMRNTPTPLTIAFLDSGGAVVSTADMDPCEDVDGCPTYAAAGPYRLAVEVPQGELASIGLDDQEAKLELAGACTPL